MEAANIIFDLGGVIFDYDRTTPNPQFYPLDSGLDILKKCAAQKDHFGNKLHKIYILSNWGKTGFSKISSQYPDIINLFDGYVISGEVGYCKPDQKIFEELISRYKLADKHCIFIDDTQTNITTANKLGWSSILYNNTNDINALLIKLNVF